MGATRSTNRIAGKDKTKMVDVYYDKDADLAHLEGKTIGIVGYGSQGHAHALNLKDNGQNVVVGLYPESNSRAVAEAAGLRVADVPDVAKEADVLMMLIPSRWPWCGVMPTGWHSDTPGR